VDLAPLRPAVMAVVGRAVVCLHPVMLALPPPPPSQHTYNPEKTYERGLAIVGGLARLW
jgi:hypothetical protein